MSLLFLQQLFKATPKKASERFRIGQIISFKSDIHSEDEVTVKNGEIIYIHPKGYFITVIVTYSNGNKHQEAINWLDFNNVDILIGNFWR